MKRIFFIFSPVTPFHRFRRTTKPWSMVSTVQTVFIIQSVDLARRAAGVPPPLTDHRWPRTWTWKRRRRPTKTSSFKSRSSCPARCTLTNWPSFNRPANQFQPFNKKCDAFPWAHGVWIIQLVSEAKKMKKKWRKNEEKMKKKKGKF